jgi:hypothetical protein
MDYLKLPTDNLYKFVAFAGLASLVASLIYAPYFIQMTTREINRLGSQCESRIAEMDNLVLRGIPLEHLEKMRLTIERTEPSDGARTEAEIDDSLKQIQELEGDLLNLSTLPAASNDDSKKYWMDALAMSEDDFKTWANNIDGDNLLTRTVKAARLLRPRIPEIISATLEIEDLREQVKQANRWSYWGVRFGVLSFVTGIVLWYIKVQRPADLLASNQAAAKK